MSFEELKAELFSKGGQKEDWDQLLGGGLSYEDLVPYVAGESRESPLARANQVMGAGRMIEYDCYDGRWRGQGKAVVELVSYEDESAGTLKAIHLAASDGYYSYYAEEKLAVDNVVYHLCTGEAKKCGFKLPRGDRREVVHLARWRMVNPSILMLEGWSKDVAMACMRDGVRKFVPHPMEPPRVPGAAPAAAGSGLDAALAAIPVVDDKEDRPQRREKNPESSRRSQKRSVSQIAGEEDELKRQRKDERKEHDPVEV